MDESDRIADALQGKYPECIALFTYPGRDSMSIGMRREKEGEWEPTMYQMCHMHGDYSNTLLVLADGGEQIADIATYWDDESGSWETSVEVFSVEYAEHKGSNKDEWRASQSGGYYRIGDEIDVNPILEDDDDDEEEEEEEDEDEDEDEDDE